jgi:hypothetical protein
MSACSAGKLCASYILGEKELPIYATYFHPSRYENAAIQKEMTELDSDGQL